MRFEMLISEMETRALFGGAIDVVLPKGFIDLSDFRQVPDHQEVFTAPGEHDVSIVFEIVELQSQISNDNTGSFFWADLVQSNEAQEHHILYLHQNAIENEHYCRSIENVPLERFKWQPSAVDCFAVVVSGEQKIVKTQNVPNRVKVSISASFWMKICVDLVRRDSFVFCEIRAVDIFEYVEIHTPKK